MLHLYLNRLLVRGRIDSLPRTPQPTAPNPAFQRMRGVLMAWHLKHLLQPHIRLSDVCEPVPWLRCFRSLRASGTLGDFWDYEVGKQPEEAVET